MAVSRVGYNSGTTTTSNTVLTPDVSIATDDWMVVVFAGATSQTITPPSGWVNIVSPGYVTGTMTTHIFAKKRLVGETSYTFTHPSAVQYVLVWLRGVADTGWITGAPHARADGSGNTTQNIAYSITTTVPGTEVLVISTERTSVQETGIASVTGATEWVFKAQPVSTYLETLWVGYKDMPTTGNSGNVTVTYPNTQTANGYSIQLGLPPVTPPGVPETPLQRWDGTVLAPLTAKLWNGTAEVPVTLPADPVYGKYTITDLLSTPQFYIAHRGSGGNWPEHTMRSYTGAANWGMKALEISVVPTSDGVLVCNHDTTTTRTTGTALTVGSATWAQLQALTHRTTDTDNPSQPVQPFTRLDAVLAKFAKNQVLFIEPKIGGVWQQNLRDLIMANTDNPARIVWKASINATGFTNAKALGMSTWGYYIYGDPLYDDVEGLAARTDIDMLGVEVGAPTAWQQRIVAAGVANNKPVITWAVSTIADRDRLAALGVRGFMTSNIRVVLPKFT
jgi:glycerophosphoryl diester phosphodiesterase